MAVGSDIREKTQSDRETVPPHARLIEMAMAHWISRIVYVAAKLGLADLLAETPKSAEELAGPTTTHAPSLYRLMRTLASLGVLTEDDSHRFSLTRSVRRSEAERPVAARATVLTIASDWWVQGFQQLHYSVETGKSGFEKTLGMPVFDWLARNPEQASLFSETMVGIHGGEPPAVAAAYDFSRFGTIVDVGGATGNLLTTILAAHPGPRGVLFDLEHVVRDAPAMIRARGLDDRVTIEAGSFFERVPARRGPLSSVAHHSRLDARPSASRSWATAGVR